MRVGSSTSSSDWRPGHGGWRAPRRAAQRRRRAIPAARDGREPGLGAARTMLAARRRGPREEPCVKTWVVGGIDVGRRRRRAAGREARGREPLRRRRACNSGTHAGDRASEWRAARADVGSPDGASICCGGDARAHVGARAEIEEDGISSGRWCPRRRVCRRVPVQLCGRLGARARPRSRLRRLRAASSTASRRPRRGTRRACRADVLGTIGTRRCPRGPAERLRRRAADGSARASGSSRGCRHR